MCMKGTPICILAVNLRESSRYGSVKKMENKEIISRHTLRDFDSVNPELSKSKLFLLIPLHESFATSPQAVHRHCNSDLCNPCNTADPNCSWIPLSARMGSGKEFGRAWK